MTAFNRHVIYKLKALEDDEATLVLLKASGEVRSSDSRSKTGLVTGAKVQTKTRPIGPIGTGRSAVLRVVFARDRPNCSLISPDPSALILIRNSEESCLH